MQSCFSIIRRLLTAALYVCSLLIQLPAVCVWADEPGGVKPADVTELSLERLMNIEVDTVYGASKYEQKVTEAPSSISIITADEIKKYGYRNLEDVLRSVRGFIVTNDRSYSYVGVRGFGRAGDWNSRILIQVDGHRINEISYDSVYVANEFILDVDLIDHIEIIRGPSSSLYGDNAFFAVISIFTKKGRTFQGTEVSGAAGSHEMYQGRASYGDRFKDGGEMVLSGSALDSKGQKNLYFREYDPAYSTDPRAGNNGVAENLDGEKNYSLFGKYSSGGLTLEGAYVERRKVIPTAWYGTVFNDSRNITFDGRDYIDLKYEHEYVYGLKILARTYYDQAWYHEDLPLPSAGDIIMNKDQMRATWWGGELQITKELFTRHRIVAGVEYQNHEKVWFENHDENVYPANIDLTLHSKKWALFAQDEIRITDDLILNAGVRNDHYDTFGATTNPRLGLIYDPAPKSTVKLLYGKAFRAPNTYELYYAAPQFNMKGNPDLKPEKISTMELIYERYLGNHYLVTIAGFENRIKGLIDQDIDAVDGQYVFVNKTDVKAQGVEAEVEGKWKSGYRHKISYTYTRAKDEQTGAILANSSEHMIKVNIMAPVWKEDLFAGLDVQYLSRRKTEAEQYASGFVLANVTVFRQNLMKGLELSGSIYNLFDKKYVDPVAIDSLPLDVVEQDGRTYRVKLTYRF